MSEKESSITSIITIGSAIVAVTSFVLLMNTDVAKLKEDITKLRSQVAVLECRIEYVERSYKVNEDKRARNGRIVLPGTKCGDINF